jgi:hypothetical protein
MKLTDDIKRMLNALAYANAGDYLTLPQKDQVLQGSPAPASVEAAAGAAPAASGAKRPHVGLYLGSELSADVMQYVAQTCARLRHDLTVLTFESETEARALLAPYQAMLDKAGTGLSIVVVSGEPPAALARALRRRPEIAFLVCNEAGYLGHSLMAGTPGKDTMPVPVVMVAANEAAIRQPGDKARAGVARAS